MLKPGYKTTEFLLTLATNVGVLAASLAEHLSPRYAAIASAVSVAAYALGRSIAKAGTNVAKPPPTTPV
jgi:hypothetical protein